MKHCLSVGIIVALCSGQTFAGQYSTKLARLTKVGHQIGQLMWRCIDETSPESLREFRYDQLVLSSNSALGRINYDLACLRGEYIDSLLFKRDRSKLDKLEEKLKNYLQSNLHWLACVSRLPAEEVTAVENQLQ